MIISVEQKVGLFLVATAVAAILASYPTDPRIGLDCQGIQDDSDMPVCGEVIRECAEGSRERVATWAICCCRDFLVGKLYSNQSCGAEVSDKIAFYAGCLTTTSPICLQDAVTVAQKVVPQVIRAFCR